MENKIVLQKYIAESGLCSRRKADKSIRQGKVFVNGKPAELGMRVDESDEVKVNGKIVAQKNKKIYIALNKPKGYTCTSRRFKEEKNVFELLNPPHTPPERGIKERLFMVGRLDKASKGLVLLTNNGELAQKLTHPKFEHEKVYELKVKSGKIKSDNKEAVNRLKQGIDIGGGDGVVKAKKVKYIGGNKFEIVLTEGKKRQIRRMFEALGFEVVDLKRTAIGKLELGNLSLGEWRYVDKSDIID